MVQTITKVITQVRKGVAHGKNLKNLNGANATLQSMCGPGGCVRYGKSQNCEQWFPRQGRFMTSGSSLG